MICKKHYLSLLHSDLNPPAGSSSPYQRLVSPSSEIIPSHFQWLQAHQLPVGAAQLPFYSAIGKLQKSPPQCRFLANAANVTTTPINSLLSRFFRGLMPDLTSLWMQTVQPIPGMADASWSWVLSNTEDLIPRLQLLNHSSHASPVSQSTGDFQRLYTNLPLQSLKSEILSLLLSIGSSLHADHPWLLIPYDKSLPLSGCSIGPPPSQTPHAPSLVIKKRYFVASLAELCDAFEWLMDKTFISFGCSLYQQIIGIPMGGNAAVLIANF